MVPQVLSFFLRHLSQVGMKKEQAADFWADTERVLYLDRFACGVRFEPCSQFTVVSFDKSLSFWASVFSFMRWRSFSPLLEYKVSEGRNHVYLNFLNPQGLVHSPTHGSAQNYNKWVEVTLQWRNLTNTMSARWWRSTSTVINPVDCTLGMMLQK